VGALRLYVAGKDDTFDIIAKHYHLSIERLHMANPQLPVRQANLSGRIIRIPSMDTPVFEQSPFSCPPSEPKPYLDHWIPLTPLAKMAETEYDILIIGSGIGGGAALWRLCEHWMHAGKRIGIVEKGGLLLQTHSWNVPTLNNDRAGRLFANPAVSNPIGRTLPSFSGAREVYSLGGRTQFWGLVSPRIQSHEMKDWPVSHEEMTRYYNIAEGVMNVTDAYSKDSSLTRELLDRLWQNGFPEAEGSPMAIDVDPTKYGEIHSAAAFSSINFFAKALNLAPFDLAVNAYATRIVMQEGKVAGVEVSNPVKQAFYLRAKTVIVAASSLQAPRLLLHSGIPGRAIGHYLTNNSFVVTNGTIRTSHLPEVLGTLAVLVPSTARRPYQVQIQGPGPYYWYHDTAKELQEEWGFNFFGGFGTVESRFENNVFLDPSWRDEYGVPNIGVNFSYSHKDNAIIEQMKADIPLIAEAAGIQLTGPSDRPDLCLLPPGSDLHEFGTCRMGNDPLTSATNRYGQIHGISGLYAAGNCVLPSIGAANPTLTAAAMAIRTVDHIVQSMD
jgi:choline dehydrogenase-like flavoprotein